MTVRFIWAPMAPRGSVSDTLAATLKARIVTALAREDISIDSAPVWYHVTSNVGCTDPVQKRSPILVFAGLGYDSNRSMLLIVWATYCGRPGEVYRVDMPTSTRELPRTVDSVARSLARTLQESR
jgi:hypothetical protein